MKPVELQTERLALRPLGPEYLESTHAYAADAENTKYMMFLPNESLDETRRFLADCARAWQEADPYALEFAILLDGAHIGGAGLYFDAGPGAAELGWVLRRDCHGRGYATEAARALMDFARERLGIRRFVAHCDAENLASQGVMRKLGMTLTDAAGTRRNRGSDELRREYAFERVFE